ncbi:MAG: TetR family transcriptional regulator C-terminal domain-containing protein, partial [Oscillospiraceae bacterium]|nr:TetR family transcriptional regulator C-terminal domain-containing protein [Oscillospiraceae bacterium]
YDNADVFRNLLMDEGNHELRKMFTGLFVDEFSAELHKKQAEGRMFPLPIPILSVFVAGGMAHLLMWWISGDSPYTKEEMIGHLTDIARREKDPRFLQPES